MTATDLPQLVDINVLAARSGYKPASIRNMVSAKRSIGRLALHVAGRLRWRVADVDRWLAGELDGADRAHEQPADAGNG